MNIYRDALFSQGACNLGALVRGWARVIERLQQQAHTENRGTQWVNEHPVNVLFAEQSYHLTGCGRRYFEASQACREGAEAEASVRQDLVKPSSAPRASASNIRLNGTRVKRVGDTIYVPLPRELWRSCGGCACSNCKGAEGFWDTLAIPAVAGEHEETRTVHCPELHLNRAPINLGANQEQLGSQYAECDSGPNPL